MERTERAGWCDPRKIDDAVCHIELSCQPVVAWLSVGEQRPFVSAHVCSCWTTVSPFEPVDPSSTTKVSHSEADEATLKVQDVKSPGIRFGLGLLAAAKNGVPQELVADEHVRTRVYRCM